MPATMRALPIPRCGQHCIRRADLIHVAAGHYRSHREVNAFMARALQRFDTSEPVVWIHDYHFLPLGAEMRRLGSERPIGFFLHTPWPDRHGMAAVPHHREIVQDMLAYDLVGFQTIEDRRNFEDYLRHELGVRVENDTIASAVGRTRPRDISGWHRRRRLRRAGKPSPSHSPT